jgi:hypothetical protein
VADLILLRAGGAQEVKAKKRYIASDFGSVPSNALVSFEVQFESRDLAEIKYTTGLVERGKLHVFETYCMYENGNGTFKTLNVDPRNINTLKKSSKDIGIHIDGLSGTKTDIKFVSGSVSFIEDKEQLEFVIGGVFLQISLTVISPFSVLVNVESSDSTDLKEVGITKGCVFSYADGLGVIISNGGKFKCNDNVYVIGKLFKNSNQEPLLARLILKRGKDESYPTYFDLEFDDFVLSGFKSFSFVIESFVKILGSVSEILTPMKMCLQWNEELQDFIQLKVKNTEFFEIFEYIKNRVNHLQTFDTSFNFSDVFTDLLAIKTRIVGCVTKLEGMQDIFADYKILKMLLQGIADCITVGPDSVYPTVEYWNECFQSSIVIKQQFVILRMLRDIGNIEIPVKYMHAVSWDEGTYDSIRKIKSILLNQ